MQIAVIHSAAQQMEVQHFFSTKEVFFFDSVNAITSKFDALFDYTYDNTPQHNAALSTKAGMVFINAVVATEVPLTIPYIRFNGWHSFITKLPLEIAVVNDAAALYKSVLDHLHITYIVVPNIIGLITPRVVSMLVNEAYYALGENVSTKKEIDIAMQLGTSYPYGPFAWSEKIGINDIKYLLRTLAITDARYTLAPMLKAITN